VRRKRKWSGADEALKQLLAAARAHGDDAGSESEIGDLQELLGCCWSRLTDEQRVAVLDEFVDPDGDFAHIKYRELLGREVG
jgi:hypothetical protein